MHRGPGDGRSASHAPCPHGVYHGVSFTWAISRTGGRGQGVMTPMGPGFCGGVCTGGRRVVPRHLTHCGDSFVARSGTGGGTGLLPRKPWTVPISVRASPRVSPRLSRPQFCLRQGGGVTAGTELPRGLRAHRVPRLPPPRLGASLRLLFQFRKHGLGGTQPRCARLVSRLDTGTEYCAVCGLPPRPTRSPDRPPASRPIAQAMHDAADAAGLPGSPTAGWTRRQEAARGWGARTGTRP